MNSTVDWSSVFQPISDQATSGISAILPIAAPVAGVLLAVGIGWRVYKKLTGR
ncbi:hypothetical protein AAC03nite_38740 [Alicyclobacillus acidoterrestris]|nr:hypothetical protein AAC03nite_38740 [Alicyclobacillus acidoterrestris]